MLEHIIDFLTGIMYYEIVANQQLDLHPLLLYFICTYWQRECNRRGMQ